MPKGNGGGNVKPCGAGCGTPVPKDSASALCDKCKAMADKLLEEIKKPKKEED